MDEADQRAGLAAAADDGPRISEGAEGAHEDTREGGAPEEGAAQ